MVAKPHKDAAARLRFDGGYFRGSYVEAGFAADDSPMTFGDRVDRCSSGCPARGLCLNIVCRQSIYRATLRGLASSSRSRAGWCTRTRPAGLRVCIRNAKAIYIPLRNDTEEGASEGGRDRQLRSPEHELVEYFFRGKYEGSGATWGLDEEDAIFIESVLAKWDLGECFRIDRARLVESHEAWVHVTVVGEHQAFSGFGPYPRSGILTWTNSD